jgi:p-methyltransferase
VDCIVIGYNETPFAEYVDTLKSYGEESEAYRDLKMSFVNIEGQPLPYIDLLNQVMNQDPPFRSGEIPNLAAAYLTHFLRRRDLEADYINLFQGEKERLVELLAQNPLCVAITTTFYVINFPVNQIVNFIRRHHPTVPIIVGGVLIANHVNAFDESGFLAALRDMREVDIFVVESQGEETLHRVVQCLKTGGELSDVENLVYKDSAGQLQRTASRTENNSLDDEAIDWRMFADKELGATVQTRTARSCSFACAFCGYPQRGGPLTLASMDTITRELESLRELGDVANVVFIDDTFNVPKTRFKEFCRMLIERDFRFNWFSYFRCDHGDEEAIDLMAESGCKGVFLGTESGSQEMLVLMNKRAKLDNYRRGIKLLKERGIITFASFITGFPGETEATVAETLDFIATEKPDFWRTQLWYCDVLTPVYKEKKEEFKIRGEGFKWEHYTMGSMEAMALIEEMFLQVKDSIWLPQYSFDFWIIPYLMGCGLSREDFAEFMRRASKLMALDVASLDETERAFLEHQYLDELRSWRPQPSVHLAAGDSKVRSHATT